ncbi:3-isopropylmalate dehydratase small subunit [Sphingosinicella rhizophila]|uniref:3-isopropylmalate dehydratase small subunit n=1 Tax=Sphingosinicella rhizophila TaxID=3050082 RepID=A0ABU3QAX7_9SPHN|nr:3-isopropylmalate dehydratase small subunit [Sphingosinicella sp. GR2756]MDT9600526.1 3-isopropylmalate dehydratase small subunit [Sphingosinicella sp. GR2756]
MEVITGIAVPLLQANVDTDQILPKQFLRTISREGLGDALFFDWRFDEAGAEYPDFILNQSAYRRSSVLIAGENFACGSSREHAVWALLDFGFSCVIAPSFAEIFASNAVNNGLLLITLSQASVEALAQEAIGEGANFRIDLPLQRIIAPSGREIFFDFDQGVKRKLIAGLDAIGETFLHEHAIAVFEARQSNAMPWLSGRA